MGLVVRRRARAPRRLAQLAARGVRVCGREPGSGARALLDRLLAAEGIPRGRLDVVETASSHLAVARSVASGASDAGVSTAAAAAAFGLDFVPLATSRFDLVMAPDTAASPSGARLIDVLAGRRFRRDAGALPGYSTADTGKLLARAS
jgi:molybdate-binding protein